MNFDLTEEQKLIQETAREFAVEQLQPAAADLDRYGDDGTFQKNLTELAKLGFMGLCTKQSYGGAEAGAVAFSIAITELAKACASTAVTVSVNNMVCEIIQTLGSEAQRQEYVSGICSGRLTAGAFALTEAGAGSDPAGMKTTASADGEDYLLNGSKLFITSGALAGVFLVWAVTAPQAAKGKGISLFLVPAESAGLRVGKNEEKMGQCASATNEIQFQDCRIPKSALLGKLNDGFRIAMNELAGGRIGIGSLALGIGLAAMDAATAYSLTRTQFGQKISKFEAIQWKIADMYTALEASKLLLFQAAYRKEKNLPYSKEASMAKLFATEAGNKACYEAMQIFGGYGYTKDLPLERFARDVRVTTIYEGTSEIQRLIIAREILKQFS